jgi:hypothetical protein
VTPTELRDLDAEVQRKVFGSTDLRRLPVYHSPDCGSKMIGYQEWLADWCYLPAYEHDEKGDQFCEVVPAYSGDIAAAFRLLEYIPAGSCRFHRVENRWTVIIHPKPWSQYGSMGFNSDPGRVEVEDESLPVAICKAALLAAGSQPVPAGTVGHPNGNS